MKILVDFNTFIQSQSKSDYSPLTESYKFKDIRLGSITYQHVYEYIHTKMWRVAIDLVYGKDYTGSPMNNDIVINAGDDTISAPELFYFVWANIDQYTSPTNVKREDLEGKMEHLSDGVTRDYTKADWYVQMQVEKNVNAGYYSEGYLDELIETKIDALNRMPGNEMVFSEEIKKYKLESPTNVRKLIRTGQLYDILKMEEDYFNVSQIVSGLLDKKKVVEEFKKQTSQGVQKNPAFGLEDYANAIANCRGFLQMKLNQPNMTPQTIGWNFLHYMNNYIYEFLLHYTSINFSQQVIGYK
jgi:hypothetical protein